VQPQFSSPGDLCGADVGTDAGGGGSGGEEGRGERDTLCIRKGRHPTVERALEQAGAGAQFIANDVLLRCNFGSPSCQVVTGPNMGGKSSYVRMVALICLLGQIGAHVPAESAQLCIFDRIFTRMGAGDDLAAGHSTFMSELHRTSCILRRASARSLVVLDELGRGTATHDGLAIAQATLHYFLRRVGCAMLFVTHFPRIADMAEESSNAAAAAATTTVGGADGPGTAHERRHAFPPGCATNVHMSYVQQQQQQQQQQQGDDGDGERAGGEVVFQYKAVSAAWLEVHCCCCCCCCL
jgi:hypothetical protein